MKNYDGYQLLHEITRSQEYHHNLLLLNRQLRFEPNPIKRARITRKIMRIKNSQEELRKDATIQRLEDQLKSEPDIKKQERLRKRLKFLRARRRFDKR